MRCLSLLFSVVALLCFFSFPASAKEDPLFDLYLKNVARLDGTDPEDAQQAASAFIIYLQQSLPANRRAVTEHIEYPVILASSKYPKNKVYIVKNLDIVFNEVVMKGVREADTRIPISMRNWVEYSVGSGQLWFTFKDDDVKQPVIFAINNM